VKLNNLKNNMSMAKRERLFALYLMTPCFLLVLVFAFFPIGYSFYLSLHRIILSMPGLGQPFVGIENYVEFLHDPVALQATVNTLGFVLISTFFELGFGLVIALIVHQKFKGRGLARAAVLVPWAIPTVVSSQMWRFIFNDNYGLLNLILYGTATADYKAWLADPLFAFLAIIAADVWKTSSFAGLLILAGLQTIPEDLDKSARIDGAGAWQCFRRITLPLIKPALLIALLFRTMDGFRVFGLVFVMTQGGPADSTNVLQFYGYKKIFGEGFMGYGSTISVFVFLLVLALSVLYVRLIGRRMFRQE
jgi:multiple sugar transport system permease protein